MKNKISSSKIGSYLKPTFNEILKVVLGILIALQINAWSDQIKQNKEEIRILQNLKEDVLHDIAQLQENVTIAERRQITMDSIFEALYTPEAYDTKTFLHLNFALANENHFEVNSGTFDESMAAGTIDCIRNNTIRQQIFNYYRITKRSYTDTYTIKQIYEQIFPEFFKTLVPSQEFIGDFLEKPTRLPNLEIRELAQDKDYNAMLTLKLRTEHHQILSWKEDLELAQGLLEDVEKELTEKG